MQKVCAYVAPRMKRQGHDHQNSQMEVMLAFQRLAFLNRLLFLQTSSHFIYETECLMETFNCEGSCCLFLNGYGFTVIIIFLRLTKIHHVTQR